MKSLLRACITGLAVTSATVWPVPPAGATQNSNSSNLLIYAQEWSLWPSRSSVPAGTIYVELWNRGQDMHDTWVRRLDKHGKMVGPVLGKVSVTLPGHISHATWHLKAGRYELFCSMPGHLKLGMHARLTVSRN